MPLKPPGETVEIHGYALREYRLMRGRKPAELADEVGVDRSYITKIETANVRRISVVLYNRLVLSLRLTDDRALLAVAPKRLTEAAA